MQATVNVRTKLDSLVADLAQVRQAIDLKTTAIGQNRAYVPSEFVQSTVTRYQVIARP